MESKYIAYIQLLAKNGSPRVFSKATHDAFLKLLFRQGYAAWDPFSQETEDALKALTEYLQRIPNTVEYEGASWRDLLLHATTALFRPEFREDILRRGFGCEWYPTMTPKPPINAQIILDLLLPSDQCEALVGDLEEIYGTKYKRVGQRGADLWFWKEVFVTIWPLLRAARFGFSVNVIAFALRMLGLGSIADQLKAASLAKSQKKKRKGT